MIDGKDPMVGQALDLLVPDFAVDADELLAAAHAGAVRVRARRRRRQIVAVIAFAALLLFAGAAIAADKYDLLPFLHTSDRNTARFSVSPTHKYRGAAPLALTCPSAHAGSFTCNVTGPMAPGTRLFQRGMRTDEVPLLTRQSMLDALDKAQADGADPAQVARARSDLAAVGDDFIRALGVVSQIETVSGGGGGSTGSSGTERVPPPGVPSWTACRELTLTVYRCRPLAALTGVASGTPLYFLQASKDWRTVQAPPTQRSDFGIVLERALGRKPNEAETRFFIDFATVASNTGGSGTGPTKGTPTAVSDPRATALLAPQSLGVRTRAISATALPLPHGRLPGGLMREEDPRLYRVLFELLGADGVDRLGRHTIYVYVTRAARLGVWRIVWVAPKP